MSFGRWLGEKVKATRWKDHERKRVHRPHCALCGAPGRMVRVHRACLGASGLQRVAVQKPLPVNLGILDSAEEGMQQSPDLYKVK